MAHLLARQAHGVHRPHGVHDHAGGPGASQTDVPVGGITGFGVALQGQLSGPRPL